MASKPGPKPGTVNNPKGINQYSTSGPKQRSIVGATRVMERAFKDYHKAQDIAASNPWTSADVKGLPKNGVVKTFKNVKEREDARYKTRDRARVAHSKADDKFLNYRVETAHGKTPIPGVNSESREIYKRMRKSKM